MAEEEITKLQDESFRVTVVRPPMVYGAKCFVQFVLDYQNGIDIEAAKKSDTRVEI